jgi:hypothetical protein
MRTEWAEADAAPARAPWRRQLAWALTELLAPLPVVAALLLVIAWQSAATPAEALRWGSVAVLFVSAIPFLYIWRAVRRRRLTDRHVRRREQRPLPLLVAIGSVVLGMGLLALWGAPRTLVALIAAMVVGLAVSLAVTLAWKVSIHTAVVAGAVVILVLVFGPLLLALTPLVAAAGWARVELRDHTPAQVVVGAGLGAVIAAAVFAWLR